MSKLAGYMAFIIFINAAIIDGTEEQRARLKAEIKPMLEQLQRNEITIEPIMDRTMDIMGMDWEMNEKAKMAIDALIGDDGGVYDHGNKD